MIHELLYTSHEGQGLRKGGGGGFCTVLSSEGMAPNLATALERLSGYKHPFDIHDPRSERNPVNYRHAILRVGGVTYHVLSRIADLRHEHTGRSNKLAHHLAIPKDELPPGGPTAVLMAAGVMRDNWDGNVGVVPARSAAELPQMNPTSGCCENWRSVARDAGWAGDVAEHLLTKNAQLSVIYQQQTETLPLVDEVFSLLRPERRWQTTFSTYFTSPVAGTTCNLRFYLDGTTEAEGVRRDYREKVVDLTTNLGPAGNGPLARAARTGEAPVVPKETLVTSPSRTAVNGGSTPEPISTRPHKDNELRVAPPDHRRREVVQEGRTERQLSNANQLSDKKSRLTITFGPLQFTALVLLLLVISVGAFLLGQRLQFSTSHDSVARNDKSAGGNDRSLAIPKTSNSDRTKAPPTANPGKTQSDSNTKTTGPHTIDGQSTSRTPPQPTPAETKPPPQPTPAKTAEKKPQPQPTPAKTAEKKPPPTPGKTAEKKPPPTPGKAAETKPSPQHKKTGGEKGNLVVLPPFPKTSGTSLFTSPGQEITRKSARPHRIKSWMDNRARKIRRLVGLDALDMHSVVQRNELTVMFQDKPVCTFLLKDNSLSFVWKEESIATLDEKQRARLKCLKFCDLAISVGSKPDHISLSQRPKIELKLSDDGKTDKSVLTDLGLTNLTRRELIPRLGVSFVFELRAKSVDKELVTVAGDSLRTFKGKTPNADFLLVVRNSNVNKRIRVAQIKVKLKGDKVIVDGNWLVPNLNKRSVPLFKGRVLVDALQRLNKEITQSPNQDEASRSLRRTHQALDYARAQFFLHHRPIISGTISLEPKGNTSGSVPISRFVVKWPKHVATK